MNNLNFCQIYHVSRCGSTLLTSLLSNIDITYSEPKWAMSLLDDPSPIKIEKYKGSIVKFQSIITSIGYKPNGPKIFLYRPLLQYLYKMNSCEENWSINRKYMYSQFYDRITSKELKGFFPKNILQLHAIFWASCIIEMQKYNEVLWITSNSFFKQKELTANNVVSHFNKKGIVDMKFHNVNVKNFNLNGDEILTTKNFSNKNLVDESYGIIEDFTAMENQNVAETVDWAIKNIPINSRYFFNH